MRIQKHLLQPSIMSTLGERCYLPLFSALALIIFGMLFVSCSRNTGTNPQNAGQSVEPGYTNPKIAARELNPGNFAIKPRYDHIKSYPTGGGVFLIRLVPEENFTGTVNLSLLADVHLNARLDRNSLNKEKSIAEITVRPSCSIDITTHIIEVKATQGNTTEILTLEVEVINWSGSFSREAVHKRDVFINWLHVKHPEFGNFSGRNWFTYATYPGILVVEHWTFLDSDWEMRICWHVMIPPYDWSKIMLRRRGEWNPIFAAHRNTDGNIYEIPVSEYPIFDY